MHSVEEKIEALRKLGDYMDGDSEQWRAAKERAIQQNAWFTPEAVNTAASAIARCFLSEDLLEKWLSAYSLPQDKAKVGLVMAGNIPLVGFHDFLCGFLCGHEVRIKLSSKDGVLLPHLIRVLSQWTPDITEQIHIAEMLKGCDAYIATGSNNSSRYFESYFSRYPHIIRRNRTSVAVLAGDETPEQLSALGTDVFTYFGRGCRNVTAVHVPQGYDFKPLLEAFEPWADLVNHNKYKNNYDYHLALYLLNRIPYLTNESVLLVDNALPFAAVSVLHYQYYSDRESTIRTLRSSVDIQAVVGTAETPFGSAQHPSLTDYADGVDTMRFLCTIPASTDELSN